MRSRWTAASALIFLLAMPAVAAKPQGLVRLAALPGEAAGESFDRRPSQGPYQVAADFDGGDDEYSAPPADPNRFSKDVVAGLFAGGAMYGGVALATWLFPGSVLAIPLGGLLAVIPAALLISELLGLK